jgi:type IV pilus assembly protein PilV
VTGVINMPNQETNLQAAVQPMRHARHKGFTLVEVLVALLVMSIGLLGVGKLVLFAARANDSAYLRSQATSLAYSIIDAMRANRTTALTGAAYPAGYVGTASAATNPGNICILGSTCTSGTLLVQYDMWQWRSAIKTALGQTGDGTVTTAAVTDPVSGAISMTATISVTWDDSVAKQTFGAAAGLATVTLETIL